jgi:hypothetical protein
MLLLHLFVLVGLASSGRVFFLNDEDDSNNHRQPGRHHQPEIEANHAAAEIFEDTGILPSAGVEAKIFGDDDNNLTAILMSEIFGGDIDIQYANLTREEDGEEEDDLVAKECRGAQANGYCAEPANYPYTAVSKALAREKMLVSRLREVSPHVLRYFTYTYI